MGFNKIVIVGVGLIGGSIGLACREKGLAQSIVGVGRTPTHLEKAVQLGAIDTFEMELVPAMTEADLIILATPVDTILQLLPQFVQYLKPGAIVTDVGSTKAGIVATAEQLMPQACSFVGGHPIAGREISGVDAASAHLFRGAKSILTPTPLTNPDALAQVKALWEQLGSQVVLMDVEQHDRTLAMISHLPHMVAYSLVNTVAQLDNEDNKLIALSAGGFRDFTRIAASDPVMWRDICLSNAQYIIEAIEHFQSTLQHLKQAISTANAEVLLKEFKAAQRAKQQLQSPV